MYNEIYWITLLLINWIGVYVSWKCLRENGLYMWIVASLIIANIVVLKITDIFGIIISLGNIQYASIMLCNDILNEYKGYDYTKIIPYIGIFTIGLMVITGLLTISMSPAEGDFINPSLINIFSITPRILIGSIVAYIFSQKINSLLYNKLAQTNNKIYFKSNISTIISQLVDSTIFCMVAFYGLYDMDILIEIGMSTYILKFVLSLLNTPILYLCKR